MKRNKTIKERRSFAQREKKLDKIHYRLLIFFMILYCLNYAFFEPQTVGSDRRYTVFIFVVPVISGMLCFSIYRRKFLYRTNKELTTFLEKAIGIIFYTIQGIIFSYLTFGLVASIVWNCVNKNVSSKNPEQRIACEIRWFDFDRRSSNTVSFTFENKYESLYIGTSPNDKEYALHPKDYYIELTVRKGVWKYYLVEGYRISKK